ncbi:MAG: efflux RND transporter permease subunit [Rugosibacter sp.]|jgi:multidrug efflux pump
MKNFNISAWSIRHPAMVTYLIIILMIAGILSYFKLGRAEDPDFTFRVMVVRTLWPGATATEVEQQISERLEKKLQEVGNLDYIRSSSKPGESLIFISLNESTPPTVVPEAWRQVRRKLDDIRSTLPAGVVGPFPNDEFGDVNMNIFALAGKDFTMGELRREADRIAREMRNLENVKKVELFGVQEEKIWVEADPQRLAALGITAPQLFDAVQKQNTVTPAGFVETASDRVRLNITGSYSAVGQIQNTQLRVGGQSLRLGDIAQVRRGYAEPANWRMRFNGQDVVGIGVVMSAGGNILALGKDLGKLSQSLNAALPAGMALHQVADQPSFVDRAIRVFLTSLAEAIAIVLAVSFLTLGWRTGLVVALSIPLVLAITFLLMSFFHVDLQRISLGALIIALGLLVDDAIIAVEMMVVKIEQGWDRAKAATFAYTSTAFPMLTGTLITAAGFIPVGFAKSGPGEYIYSMFVVVTTALVTSWVVAVTFTPFIGYKLLNVDKLRKFGSSHHNDIYDTPFYRRFRSILTLCLAHRWKVIGITLAAFVLALVAFNLFVQKQFFPHADRQELIVDLWLPQGASIQATTESVKRVEQLLAKNPGVDHYSSYIGSGAPRFYLPQDQQLLNDNFGQLLLGAKSIEARERIKKSLEEDFDAPDGRWAGVRGRVVRLENGPPVGYMVQFRVMGEDLTQLRAAAHQVANIMRQDDRLRDVHFDWNDKIKNLQVEIDQGRARALGVSTQDVALALQTWLNGVAITQYREGDQLIDVMWRAQGASARTLENLPDLSIGTTQGRNVPLSQVARLKPVLEEGLIWRRNRLPTISVRADVRGHVEGPTISSAINPQLDAIRAKLPPGFRIEMGGSIEESAKAEKSISAGFPLMVVVVFTLLMMQLNSISRSFMVIAMAPLGMIGVSIGLLVSGAPFGFVATTGVIALMGMIMRNAVILVDQIRQDEQAGKTPWDAVVDSTVRRLRPIMLTGAAAVLAMIPLAFQDFWGPMAIAIMSGLMIATVLTCLFLPALYAAVFKIHKTTAAAPAQPMDDTNFDTVKLDDGY